MFVEAVDDARVPLQPTLLLYWPQAEMEMLQSCKGYGGIDNRCS